MCLVLAIAAPARAEDPAPPPCAPDARFDRPRKTGPIRHVDPKKLVGKKPAEVSAQLRVEPGCRSARLWRFWIPDGCAYEKIVVSIWITRDRVVRATAVSYVTGQECMHVD